MTLIELKNKIDELLEYTPGSTRVVIHLGVLKGLVKMQLSEPFAEESSLLSFGDDLDDVTRRGHAEPDEDPDADPLELLTVVLTGGPDSEIPPVN